MLEIETIEKFETAAGANPATPDLCQEFLRESIVRVGARVNSAPAVSVVIPAFNVAECIVETVESVFAQTFSDYEILIVNDGSADTAALETALQPFLERIVYIKQSNGGASKARNAGICQARAELIAFLDGDDVWLPDFLESQIEFLKKNDFEMVYADALLFGDTNQTGETYMQFSGSTGAVTTVSLIGWTCNVITSGTVVYRDKIIAAGLFDESPAWKRAQDFEMWFRLVRAGARVGYQKKVLLKYRVRQGSLTGNTIEQAVRNIHVLDALQAQYEFTPAETVIWRQQKQVASAIWEMEAGKAALRNADFKAARQHFQRAAPIYSRLKIRLLSIGLTVAPRLVQRSIRNYNFER